MKSLPLKIIVFPTFDLYSNNSWYWCGDRKHSMVTNSELGMKLCVWHPKQKPITALLDPCLTVSLPKNLTAWTGTDALVHGIEAFCVDSLYSVADGMALQGLI